MYAGGRWTTAAAGWHRAVAMSEIRELRQAAGLRQRDLAALLSVPLEALRTWDSGRRLVPPMVLQRARAVVVHHHRQRELLPLEILAKELGVHVRTLRAAARTGRLEAHFSVNRSSAARCARPRAALANGSSPNTIDASAGSRFALRLFQPCPKTTMSTYDSCVNVCVSRKKHWPVGLVLRVKRSCINGNLGSARRHPCCGNASSN